MNINKVAVRWSFIIVSDADRVREVEVGVAVIET
jgi:hypothetical protein